jgi:predicted metal-binding transcription factor (methanogenesis marker protein 9)
MNSTFSIVIIFYYAFLKLCSCFAEFKQQFIDPNQHINFNEENFQGISNMGGFLKKFIGSLFIKFRIYRPCTLPDTILETTTSIQV